MKTPVIPVYGDSLVHGFPGYPFIRMLRDKCSGYRILNLGRTGDTLFSMNNRLRFLPLPRGEAAILCAGINDIYVRYAPQFKIAKALNGQWWVKDWESYRRLFGRILDRLAAVYPLVILMAPPLLGEDPDSPANRDLDKAEAIMTSLAADKPHVIVAGIRSECLALLRLEPERNPVIANRLSRLIVDVFRTRTLEGADRLSRLRGYHLTTDGVHFNGRGAALAADRLTALIQENVPLSRNE